MIATLVFAVMFSIGFIIGKIVQGPRDRDPDWRRSFTHENINRPMGPPPLKLKRSKPIRMDEGTIQRGNGYSGPTTPKPNITPRPQSASGYQPRSQGGNTNPPPRNP